VTPIHGTVAPGFERVAQTFEENFAKRGEVGAAAFAYLRGEPVVDLWAGYADRTTQRPWERDTLCVTFSSTKGIVASSMLVLADRGVLDVDARVAEYWPAFAQAGKTKITVRQLLNHRSGLAAIEQPLTLDDFHDPERVSAALEAQEPLWEPGSQQGYCAVSWGPYAGELFRRAAGERLGGFIRREITEPFDATRGSRPSTRCASATPWCTSCRGSSPAGAWTGRSIAGCSRGPRPQPGAPSAPYPPWGPSCSAP
jgi:CubicO group peptidase (beta-lactamase class C family)